MNATLRSTIWLCGALICVLFFTAACRPVQAPSTNALPAPTQAAPEAKGLDSATVADLENLIQETMSASSVPGMAACVVKDGRVVYAKGFGVTKFGTDIPVTPQSMFQVMDAGRTLVAAAVMQLVEQGKVDLDAPVTTYLPYFQMKDERYKKLAVRHLLTGSSGLPVPDQRLIKNWIGKTPAYDDGALERTVRSLSDAQLSYEPGDMSMARYSNFDYEILGDLIAKVSGQTFEAYMQEHILTPLGMTHSTYLPKQADPAGLVSPHMNEGSDVFVSDVVTDGREHGPSLGLWSTTDDMCRWLVANLNRGELDGQRILDAASYDLIWEPLVGLGWDVRTHNDGSFAHFLKRLTQ